MEQGFHQGATVIILYVAKPLQTQVLLCLRLARKESDYVPGSFPGLLILMIIGGSSAFRASEGKYIRLCWLATLPTGYITQLLQSYRIRIMTAGTDLSDLYLIEGSPNSAWSAELPLLLDKSH